MKSREEPCLPSRAVKIAARLALVLGSVMVIVPAIGLDGASLPARAAALCGLAALLCEVFAFHGGLALLVTSPVVFLFKHRVSGGAMVLLGLVLAGPGLVSHLRFGQDERGPEAFTVLSCNLLFVKADLDAIESVVDREMPDVIVFQEVTGDRANEVRDRFSNTHPYVARPVSWRWGNMLLSQTPFVGEPTEIPGHPDWPIAQPSISVEYDGRVVNVVGVHLPAPNRLSQVAAGPMMASSVSEWIGNRRASSDAPAAFVFAGDFNAPLWTGRLRPLREAGLIESHDVAGWGRGATWPDKTPLKHAPGIRLDQIAFVGDLRCVDSRVLESVGSDHRPVVASFVWQ